MKNLTKRDARLVTDLAQSVSRENGWRHWPNYYTGSGGWTRCSADYAEQTARVLRELGMERGRHFSVGNDAPRRGWTGEFVRLLPLGRRRAIIQKAMRETDKE